MDNQIGMSQIKTKCFIVFIVTQNLKCSYEAPVSNFYHFKDNTGGKQLDALAALYPQWHET